MDDAAKLIRGEKGTEITLSIKRFSENEVNRFYFDKGKHKSKRCLIFRNA